CEQALFLTYRPSEGPLPVPEQFDLDQVSRQRSTVHIDQLAQPWAGRRMPSAVAPAQVAALTGSTQNVGPARSSPTDEASPRAPTRPARSGQRRRMGPENRAWWRRTYLVRMPGVRREGRGGNWLWHNGKLAVFGGGGHG